MNKTVMQENTDHFTGLAEKAAKSQENFNDINMLLPHHALTDIDGVNGARLCIGLNDERGNPLDDDWAFLTIEYYKRAEGANWNQSGLEHYMPLSWVSREMAYMQREYDSLKKRYLRLTNLEKLEAKLERLEALEAKRLEQIRQQEERKRATDGYVYLIQSDTGHYKIGRTVNPENRMRTFGVKLPFEVEYVCLIETPDMYALEAELHARFAAKRVNGEWFALDAEDVAYIKGMSDG